MTDTAPQPPALSIGNPVGNVTEGLNQALAAAPELRNRPNLAVAAAQSPDPQTYAQVLAHASNMAALHHAAHTVAANKGGQVVLQRQLAKASGRYAKATGQSLWASLGGDIVHPLEAAGNALAHGATAALNAVPGLHLGNRANELGSEVGHAAVALGKRVANTNPLGHVAPSLQYAGQGQAAITPNVHSNPLPEAQSVAGLLNAPLSETLHQYRYLHDVEARHGPVAAALAGMGLLAGAIGGGLTAGPEGIVLGAEGAEAIEARILYRDSWQRTTSGSTYVDPHTGQPVSPGRDLASGLFGLKPGSAPYNVLSGVGDAVGDMVLDPLAQAGSMAGRARSLTGMGGLLGQRFSGTAITADNVDRVYNTYASVRNAMTSLAGKTAAEIQVSDPRLAPIAQDLSELRAGDGHGALNVFRNALRSEQLTGGMQAPTLTLTRQVLNDAVSDLKKWSSAPVNPGDDPLGVLSTTKQTILVKRAVDRALASQERVPEDWDPELKAFTGKSLDLFGDTAAQTMYRMLRMGESHQTAMMTVDHFLAAEQPAERVAMWHQAISDMLLARAAKAASHGTFKSAEGIFGDSQILQKLHDAAVELSPENQVGGVYSADRLGNDTSEVVTADGKSFGAGVLQNHTGRVSVPTFDEVRRAAQAIAGSTSILGRMDDFFYQAITQRLFKRAVLLSLSFAEHIVVGEMIQSALRVGPTRMGRAIVADVAARLGAHLEDNPDEAGIIARTVDKILAGYKKLDPEHYAVASALQVRRGVEQSGGRFAALGVSAGHHVGAEAKTTEGLRAVLARARAKAPSERFTDVFSLEGWNPKTGAQRWASWLNEIGADPASQQAAKAFLAAKQAGATDLEAEAKGAEAAKEWLDAQPDEALSTFVRHKTAKSQQAWDNGIGFHEDWARVGLENALAATTTTNGVLRQDLVRRIADGGRFDPAEFEDTALANAPKAIKGRQVEHYVSGKLERIAAAGHRKVLSPFINALSRDPTYIHEVTVQMKALQPLMDAGMGFDEAMNVAETRAVQHMVRYVHNINERTQFSEMMRNVAPFFFAQQQAYKRLFRMGVENPGALRRYQIGLQALQDFGVHHKNEYGLEAVAYPGIGSMTSGMLQGFSHLGLAPKAVVPIQWLGALSSANVIAPFSEGTGSLRPDLGPMVSIPLAGLHMLFPELANAGLSPKAMQQAENVVGAIQGPIAANESTPQKFWSQFVPNAFVQRMMEGLDTGLLNTYYSSSVHQMMAALDHEQQQAMDRWVANGRKGPMPDYMPPGDIEKGGQTTPQQDAWRQRIVNGTRVLAIMKAFVGLVTPLSPQISFDTLGLNKKVQEDIKKRGFGPGLTHFLVHNPDASANTVFSSVTKAGGAQLPATQPAMDWIDKYHGFIQRNPTAALYFMPNSAGQSPYSQAAYQQQLSMGLRVKRTDTQFMQALYVAQGNNIYYNMLRPYYETVKVMENLGLSQADAAKWIKDPKNQGRLEMMKASSGLNNWYSASINALEKQNPTWGAEFSANSGTNRLVAGQALSGLEKALKDPEVPHNDMTTAVRTLIDAYHQFAAYLPVGDSSYATSQQAAAQKEWRAYLDAVEADNPQVKPLISAVFYDLGGSNAKQ